MTNEEMELTIDYLKNIQEGYIEGEGYERHPVPEWYALDKAMELLEQTRWISVNEKLPEKYMNCLITVKTEAYFCTPHYEVYIAWFDGKNFIYEYGNESIVAKISIIAWMPLPRPYKENEE